MQTTSRLQALPFSHLKTYLTASLFIIGNLILPQLFHLIPQGGSTWLPIYFFTLVGAYIYGWRVGIITAVASPLLNSVMFGMPAVAVLPAIMLKSVLLALIAGIAASKYRKASLSLILSVVLCYQILGTIGEWALTGSFFLACQDLRIGIPGILLQIFGGWAVIHSLTRK